MQNLLLEVVEKKFIALLYVELLHLFHILLATVKKIKLIIAYEIGGKYNLYVLHINKLRKSKKLDRKYYSIKYNKKNICCDLCAV